MTVHIRAMTADDLEACRRLWTSDEHIHAGLVDDPQYFLRYLQRNPGCSQVAETPEGTVIGALAAGHDGYRGSCHHLVVDTHWRGQGIARQLAEAAFNALLEAGIPRCFIWVYASNTAGTGFWTELGFQRWDDCPTFSKRLDE